MARAFRVYRDILGFKVDVLVPATSFMHAVFELSPEAKLRIAFLSSGEGEFGHIGLTEFPDMEPAVRRQHSFQRVDCRSPKRH